MSARASPMELARPVGVELVRHEVMRIDEGSACEIRVAHGAAWITEDGASEDIVLTQGQSVRLSGERGALLSACGREARTLVSIRPTAAPEVS